MIKSTYRLTVYFHKGDPLISIQHHSITTSDSCHYFIGHKRRKTVTLDAIIIGQTHRKTTKWSVVVFAFFHPASKVLLRYAPDVFLLVLVFYY
jgi:hypothetical protein